MARAPAVFAVVAAALLFRNCTRHRATASAHRPATPNTARRTDSAPCASAHRPATPNAAARTGSGPSASAAPSARARDAARPIRGPIPAAARQLLLAVTAGWNASRAELARFKRASASATWQPVGASWHAVTGRAGLAWGRGLQGAGAPPGRPGPVKVEGDGRAPAGAFRLGPLYGYASRPPAGARLAYTRVTDTWRCVDDPKSRYYGRVFNAARVAPDWQSAERMRLHDALYRLVVVVRNNFAPPVAGKGSCVFLHTWLSPTHGTSGCTAMPYPALQRLAAWLAPGAVLVQLPENELSALHSAWNLPGLAAP